MSQSFCVHAWPTGTRQRCETALQLLDLQSASVWQSPPTSFLATHPMPAAQRSVLGQPQTAQ
jgi:hypothetical protein